VTNVTVDTWKHCITLLLFINYVND